MDGAALAALNRVDVYATRSRLNQLEVQFSIVQRKVPTPSDFDSLAHLKHAPMAFYARYQRAAKSR